MNLYQISDGVQIFESCDSKKLIIRNYMNGKKITIDNQLPLKKLLLFLREPKSEDEISSFLPKITKENLQDVLSSLISSKTIRRRDKLKENKTINILIIGLGTTGSHLVEGICRSNINVNLHIVDPDKVDESNIARQSYLYKEIGQYKVDTFKSKFIDKNINTYKLFIENEECLEKICIENNINMVLQCGDYPSPRKLGKLVNIVCDRLNLPYIINSGYISNVVSLPEFYYPNKRYSFNYKHDYSDETLLFSQVLNKANYDVAIQPSFVMMTQIKNFINNEEPIYYHYRGYYNSKILAWEVERVD